MYIEDLLASGEEEPTRGLLENLANELDFAEPERIAKNVGCVHEIKQQRDVTEVEFGMQDYYVHALRAGTEQRRIVDAR